MDFCKSLKTGTNYFIYLLFLILSIFFLLIFSGSTSPLYNMSGVDSSIFVMMGKMFLEGKTPYVDFFDHKGPILILVEALGLSLYPSGNTGIFIIQIINLTIAQILIFHICRHFTLVLISFSIVLFCLFMFSLSIGEGNLTEEYTLPFILSSLLFTIQYHLSGRKSILIWKYFIMGISVAFLFWMRMNNMGVICACISFILVFTIKGKDWKGIKNLLVGLSLGFLLITIPIILYFAYKEGFYEMIYATFIFNMKYIGYEPKTHFTIRSFIIYFFKYWPSFIILVLGTVLYCHKTRKKDILVLTCFLVLWGVVSTRFGLYVPHYMTLNIPLLALGFALLLNTYTYQRYSKLLTYTYLIVSFSLLCGYSIWKYNSPRYREMLDDSIFIKQSSDIISHIPDNEKDKIYTYNVQSRFFLNTGIKPYYRFFIFQEWHGVHDKKIFEDINSMMIKHSPLWVIIPADNMSESGYTPANSSFYEILDREYSLLYKNEGLVLYKKK